MVGNLPFVLALNKSDLVDDWSAVQKESESLQLKAEVVVKTSAKTGESVEDIFAHLAGRILAA